jgi:hypothetical protein
MSMVIATTKIGRGEHDTDRKKHRQPIGYVVVGVSIRLMLQRFGVVQEFNKAYQGYSMLVGYAGEKMAKRRSQNK